MFYKRTDIRLVSKWFVIIGALIIILIKSGIRPHCDCQQSLKFFLGISPNLLGSFLIPFGACWLFSDRNYFFARLFRMQSQGELMLVCIVGFVMLVINEYLQLIPVFGRTFDYFDILASGAGLTTSYFVFGKMYSRINYNLNTE